MTRNSDASHWSSASFTLLVLAGVLFAMPVAAEEHDDSTRIDLLHLDRLIVQITEQDRSEYHTLANFGPADYRRSYDMGSTDVTRSNLLNSPAARYFARKLAGNSGSN